MPLHSAKTETQNYICNSRGLTLESEPDEYVYCLFCFLKTIPYKLMNFEHLEGLSEVQEDKSKYVR